MEKYRVVDDEGAKIRSEPKVSANVVGTLQKGDEFDGEISQDSLAFIKVLAPPPVGFVPEARVRPTKVKLIPDPILPEQHDAFCMLVTMAARVHGPERNYLMAAAYCGSKNLTDVGTETSEKVGPFQITAEDWKKGVALAAEKNISDFIDEDRYRWNRQHTIAALLAGACLKQLTAALGQDPTFSELYFAQLMGEGADTVLKGNRELTCSDAMKNVAPKTSYATTLKTDTTRSVKTVLEEHEKDLIRALTEALIVIDRQPLDIRIMRPEELTAPWISPTNYARTRRPGAVPLRRSA
jgi:hypothetical protein